jgi:toxin YoeB
MRLTWLTNGWKDYLYRQENDRKILQRVNEVIRDAMRNPFTGIGKPEPHHPRTPTHLQSGG